MQTNIKMILFSLLPPTILLWGTYLYLDTSEPTAPDLHPDITAIDRRLDATNPDIILVGSSLANKSIDERLMAEELGINEDKIQKLWSGMATIPAITLMIENRILKRNLHPTSIVVLSPPNWLVTSEILHDANLTMHQTNPLSDTLSNVLGRSSESSLPMLQQQKVQFQDDYTTLNQYVFGEILWHRSPEEIDEQLEMIFDFDQQRTDIKSGPLLIQHNVRQLEDSSASTNSSNTDLRLLEYLSKIVNDAGIHLIVVTVPVSDIIKEKHRVSPETLQNMIETLETHNARLLDYFEWSEPNIYADSKHMNKRGRTLFTNKLVPVLQELGILSDTLKDVKPPPVLSIPEMTWSNQPNTLLTNDTLTLTFPKTIKDTILRICASSTEASTLLTIPGTTFTRQGSKSIWCDSGTIPTIQKEQQFILSNTSTNPIIIHSIEVGDIELIQQPKHILSKRDWLLDRSISYTSHVIQENQTLSKWLQKKQTQYPNLQVGILSKYKGLTDIPLLKNGISNECRPIEVHKDTTSIPLSTCKEMWKNNQGSCVHNDQLLSIFEDSIDWHQISLSLKSERGCHFTHPQIGFGWWVYPGDVASTTFNWPKGDYTKMYIEGQSLGSGPWSIKIYAGDKVFLEHRSTDALNLALEMPLESLIPKRTPNIRVEIEVPEDSNRFIFVQKVQLQN